MIAITNVLGELVEKYRYTAFGLLTVLDAEGEEKDGDALSPWLYHGRLFEEASGLYWIGITVPISGASSSPIRLASPEALTSTPIPTTIP